MQKEDNEGPPLPAEPPPPPPKGDFYSGSLTEAMDKLRQSVEELTAEIHDLNQQSSGEHRKGL